MRRAVLLAALVLLAPLGFTASGSAQGGPSVTFSVFRVYDGGNKIYRLRLTGTISSRAAGQYVSVMRQLCGYSFATAIAGAQTSAGGFWEAETRSAPRPGFDSSTYFARWGAVKSKPVAFRGRLFMNAAEVADGRFEVYVDRHSEALQDMRGRRVVLQRLHRGRWERVASARLGPDSRSFSWVARFQVKAKGWTLRAVIPAKNARPCFNQSTTERFTS